MRTSVWVVTPEYHRHGGTERALAEQLTRWCHRFEVTIFTMRLVGSPPEGVRVVRIPRPPGPHLIRYVWWFAANHVARWWHAMRRGPPGVVYSPGVNCLDAQVISVNILFAKFYERIRPLVTRALARRHALRVLHRLLLYRLYRILEARAYSGSATLWAVSAEDAREIEARFGRPPNSVPVVRYGVDTSEFSPQRREAERPHARSELGVVDRFVLLAVANDWYKKGVDTAVRALSRLPGDVVLAVAGRDDRRSLRGLIASLGLTGRVRFWDHSEAVIRYYAAADCLVAPSREDAFHLPGLEALASGVPLIVSARAGVAEVIEPGVHALVIDDPEDDRGLSTLIERIRSDRELATRMAAAGRVLAEGCSWDAYGERTAALIDREVATPRVLVLTPDAWGVGGVERAARTTVNALAEAFGSERVGLLSVWGSDPSTEVPACRVLGARNGRPRPGRRTGVRRRAAFAWASLKAARRWRGNLVVIAFHPHLAAVGWACRVLSGAPYVVWAHGREAWGRVRRVTAWATRSSDRVVAVSRFTAGQVTRSTGSPPEGIVHLPHAVPRGLIRPNAARAYEPSVLTVAQLTPEHAYKGVDTLLEAWPRVLDSVPHARLTVVGDGPDRSRLERLAEAHGARGVDFVGTVPDPVLSKLYSEASIFCLPCRAQTTPVSQGEGFGLVFLEAAAAGLPCVAGRAGGATEAVEDGVTGILVDPHDATEVASATAALLIDSERARLLGEAGRSRATTFFSYPQFRRRVEDLVRGLVDPEARTRAQGGSVCESC